MKEISDNCDSNSNMAVGQKSKYKMNKSPKNSQREVMGFFEKLSSWREDSQREFSNIINSHQKSVKDQIEEVSKLQAQLSAITKERNYLIEIVNSLSVKMRDATATEPLPEQVENLDKDDQEGVLEEVEEQDVERSIFMKETEGHGVILEQNIWPELQF